MALLLGRDATDAPVVYDQDVQCGKLLQELLRFSVGKGDLYLLQQEGKSVVAGAEVFQAGLVCEGTRQVGLTHPGGPVTTMFSWRRTHWQLARRME